MGKYLLENVHAAHPDAALAVVVGSRGGMLRDLFAAYPWLDVREANRRSPKALWQLMKDYRGSDFTVTQYAGKGGSFSLASKIVGRLLTKRGGFVGFTDPFFANSLLYDRLVPLNRAAAPASLERAALRVRGIPVATEKLALAYIPMSGVAERLGIPASCVVVHLFAGTANRGISPGKRRALLKALRVSLGSEIMLVLTGNQKEAPEAHKAAEGIAGTKVIAGEVSLQELMNIIGTSQGVVSVDTGVAHIAAHLGRPLIVLRTCLGKQWWVDEQYGSAARITQFSRDEACTAGHVFTAFPACIEGLDENDIGRTAAAQFHG